MVATRRPMISAPELAGGRHGVEFLGDGEDAQHQERGQHDLVDKGMQRRDGQAGMGEEHARRAAIDVPRQMMQPR